MANLKDRPYIGTWSLEGRKLIQHTPDALVYVNGSITLPGCRSCDGRIDLQKFITEVSVESGVDPNGASASFTLSVPLHSSDSFARDAKFLLHPGLEVHVYKRGFFPVKGLYSNLAEPLSDATVNSVPPDPGEKAEKDKHAGHKHEDHDHDHDPPDKAKDGEKTVHLAGFARRRRKGPPTMIVLHESGTGLSGTEQTLLNNDTGVHYAVSGERTLQYGNPQTDVYSHTPGYNDQSIGIEFVHRYHGNSNVIDAPWFHRGRYSVPPSGQLEQLWRTVVHVTGQNGIPVTFGNVSGNTFSFAPRGGATGGVNTHRGSSGNHSDGTFPQLYMALRDRGWSPSEAYQLAQEVARSATRGDSQVELPVKGPRQAPGSPFRAGASEFDQRAPEGTFAVDKLHPRVQERLGLSSGGEGPAANSEREAGSPRSDSNGFRGPGDVADADILSVADKDTITTLEGVRVSESLLERFGLQGLGIEDVAAYPYYHTFHGVVIQVSHSWSGGIQTITVQCASMLHFWQYHKINQQASLAEGTGVKGSGVAISIEGHNFTGFHPYQIMYKLHQMTLGSQDALMGSFNSVSNLRSVDPGTGRSQFSHMSEYWDRRFNGRSLNLRMHGMSGQIFSTLQAAYLSRNTTDHLTKKIRGHFTRKKDSQKLDAVVGLNLGNDRFMRSFLYSQSSLNAGRGHSRIPSFNGAEASSKSIGVNVAEIQAFHAATANFNNFSLFEATYQSKLDIAQKVMELTGFEFYQDVDGDLVFKPPFWNLDTSSSRVYRIEDIDLINLSFDEKEPQCTYAVVKQSMTVADGLDVGIGGDLSKMAIHIDYRLVAKYGYRPFQFETTYMSDPQAMYYMAVARMDVINVPVNSASVTIPLRPEIRPGHPVYIPYLDCFYYIQSLSHSFSVGGQCTTTLQLVGKRAKFFAPGRTDVEGIDAIDLSDGTLPQRPLEVQSQDGTPRLSGFPNVVMALDPNRTNPLEWPTGASLQKLESAADFRRLLKLAGRSGLGMLTDNQNGTYGMAILVGYHDDGEPISRDVLFYFGDDVKSKPAAKKAVQQFKQKAEGAIVEAQEALKQYQNFKTSAPKGMKVAAQKVASLDNEIAELQGKLATYKSLDFDPANYPSVTVPLAQKKAERERWADATKDIGSLAIASEAGEGVNLIFQFMQQLQDRFWASQDAQTFEELTSAHLSQILSNRKATFAPGVKGAYRYYSASHPDPKEQGFGLVTFRTPEGGGMELAEETLQLDDEYQDITVQGYVRNPGNQSGTYSSEARLEDTRPVRGILIDTPVRRAELVNPSQQKALGQVLPTSEILTVAFGSFLTEAPRHASTNSNLRKGVGIGPSTLSGLKSLFSVRGVGRQPNTLDTPESFFLTQWDEMWAKVFGGLVLALRKTTRADPAAQWDVVMPSWEQVAFPQSMDLKPSVTEATPFSAMLHTPTNKRGYHDIDEATNAVGSYIATKFQQSLSVGFVSLGIRQDEAIKAGRLTQDVADKFAVTLVDEVASILGVPLGMGSQSKQYVVGAKHKTPQWTPVFPVSDAGGYEVTGSFQYGRGLDIEPGGVWDAIRLQDPLSVLDTKTVNDLITGLIRGKPVTVEVEKVLPGGRVVRERQTLQGKTARGALERNVLKTLRKNYSDQQLLDLGLLMRNQRDPNKFDFNMMNWISGQNEAIHKLPVINAAFSLADLSLQQEGRICNCRAAEANVRLEAFGAEGYLQLARGENDQLTEWLKAQSLRASVPHKIQQDTMRGTALEKPSGGLQGIISSFADPVSAAIQTATSAKERVRIFEAQAKAQANQSFRNVEDAFDGED